MWEPKKIGKRGWGHNMEQGGDYRGNKGHVSYGLAWVAAVCPTALQQLV